MNTYSVSYAVEVTNEAIVRASTRAEAIKKVKEVIGDPVKIDGAWKITSDSIEWRG